MKKIKFFLIGLIPGLVLVFFILNKKGASCSGYLPNSRVIAETLSKDFVYEEQFRQQMAAENISPAFLRDSIITEGNVHFERSHPQVEPCPDYLISYPDENPRIEITVKKCAEEAIFTSLKKLK